MRFYGGDPWRWLKEIPQAVVYACAEMLPRLQARESLLAVRRTAVGTGSLDPRASSSALREWARASESQRARADDLTVGRLAGIGIGVRTVPVRKG